MDTNPMLDKESALERIGGDEELYNDIIDIFFEDVPEQLGVLKDALSKQDRIVGERQSHSLKSAAANIGGEAMRQACWKAEKSFKTEPLETLIDLVNSMEAEFNKLRNHFGK